MGEIGKNININRATQQKYYNIYKVSSQNRHLEMNGNSKKLEDHSEINTQQQKVKLNQLSKFIFDCVHKYRKLFDTELMKLMIEQFGFVKQETLKRRKYDTVNILEKADIITINKDNGNFVYQMKHDVPNSIKDLQTVKQKQNELGSRVAEKKKKLQMMKTATNNYRKLIQINQIRMRSQNQSIQLPAIAITNKFTDFCSSQKQFDKLGYSGTDSEMEELNSFTSPNKQKQTIIMRFPAGTKFINNMFAHNEIFNF